MHDDTNNTTTHPDDAAEADATAATATDTSELQKQRDDLYDRLLRTSAEFDNYRKRIERERQQTTESAAAGVILDLLPLVDDFERALSAEHATDPDAYRQGIELIHKQLMEILTRRGVHPIEAVGGLFDPHFHQAVVYEPAEGRPDGEVVEQFRRGYMLGDRLLRPAMVKVAKA
ncbi:MAG TPA: nucleotide exchange factor GrpE [Vicinamibacterales bacterium]|jgi:molecular chaperone GrpE|nr:nucleotide exchange factor GrpE [Vicinamibacterales bacterium]